MNVCVEEKQSKWLHVAYCWVTCVCVCVPVCVCLAHCQVASSQITLWAAAALRHRSQRSIYSKTFTPSPRTKTNSINLCYLRVHMINCCDTSVCDVEAVVANVSWQADRLWRYWHILHGASNKPTNSDFVLRFMRCFIQAATLTLIFCFKYQKYQRTVSLAGSTSLCAGILASQFDLRLIIEN